jgi:hypothetical protein
MNEILIAIAGLITLGGSAFFGWFFARRKNSAEAQKVEVGNKAIVIDNEIKLSEYYKGLVDDLKPRYELEFKNYQATVTAKEKLMQEEIALLRRDNKLLKRQVIAKDKEIKERDRRIEELERTK